MISGNSVKVEFAKEEAFGQKASPDTRIEVLSESIIPAYNKTSEGALTGGLADGLTETMSVKVGGDFSLLAKPEQTGHILKGVFGNETVESEGDKFKHTFTPIGNGVNDFLPSYTFTIDRVASCKAYTGITFDGVSFEAAAEDRLKLTVSATGYAEETGAADASLEAEDAFSFKFHQAKVMLNAEEIEVTNVKFDYGNSLDSSVQTTKTGLHFKQPKPGKRTCSIDLEALFSVESETIRSGKFATDAVVAVSVEFENADGDKLVFTVPRAQINSMDPATATGEDTMKQSLTVAGVNSSTFVKAELINSRAEEY